MDIPSQTHSTPLESSKIEQRIAIRFTTTRIPGSPANRAKRIADDFAMLNLARNFDWDSDHIHYPSQFDSEEKMSLWMLVDFNITDQISEIDSVLTRYYKVGYESGMASFVGKNYNGAKFIKRYIWGGRVEEWEFRLKKRAAKAVVRYMRKRIQIPIINTLA